MFEFRVTKYDPAHRDDRGSYTRDEWTSAGDIGRSFAGVTLTESGYRRVENAYTAAAIAFLREAGVQSLLVSDFENHSGFSQALGEGSVLEVSAAEEVLRNVLRGEFWCRLEAAPGFVHVGYDYYMYVGVTRLCPAAEAFARQLGLFVERFESPYRDHRRI